MSTEPSVTVTVTGPDWDRLAVLPDADVRAAGEALKADIVERVRRGIGSDGRQIPAHYVRMMKPRGRYYYADDSEERYYRDAARRANEARNRLAKEAGLRNRLSLARLSASRRAERKALIAAADADIKTASYWYGDTLTRGLGHFREASDLVYPMSVIQQMRMKGGHWEKPQPGVDWRGWDDVIAVGKDYKHGTWGPYYEGQIIYYVWNTREAFLRANYGPETGLRTGTMLKDMTVKVEHKSGHLILTVGPKGPKTRKIPMFKLIEESTKRNKAAAEGQKQRKYPSSKRMAMLERIGPSGKLAASPDEAIGVLFPSDATLGAILEQHILKPFMVRWQKLPRGVPVRG